MTAALPRRRQRLATTFFLAASLASGAEAFATPSTAARSSVGKSPSTLAAAKRFDNDAEGEDAGRSIAEFEIARPLLGAATSAFLAASLLLSPDDAFAAIAPTPPSAATATSVDIKLGSVPALTRKVVRNRDQLTNYVIDSFKSLKPILDLLSESDTVTVKPPKDVKGAINRVLTEGDATFLVNGEAVDVRVESVPGAVVVRVINPNIPRLPFLKDGTAALQFVDQVVDVAPEGLERAAEEVQAIEKEVKAIEKFLMWGAPANAPVQYRGSSLDYFLSSDTLGAPGGLSNGLVLLAGVTTGVLASYAASYSYYVSLQEEADRAAAEKKEMMAEKKKAKAKAAAAKKKEEAAASANEKEKADAVKRKEAEEKDTSASRAAAKAAAEEREAYPPRPVMGEAEPAPDTPKEEEVAAEEEVEEEEPEGRSRKRDAFKRMFRRAKKP